MKKLQNDFTTLEQSKRLLELGVPADSADCYYMAIGLNAKKYGYSDFPYFMTTNYVDKVQVIEGVNFPCWSVGRLVKIYVIARGLDTAYFPIEKDEDMVKYLIRLYEEKVKDLDFSKLAD